MQRPISASGTSATICRRTRATATSRRTRASEWTSRTHGGAGPGGGYLAPWKFIKEPGITGKPGEHIENRMSAEAARFIHQHKDRPFYLHYWAYSVHSPWNARRDYIEHFQSRVFTENPQHNPLYAAMVRSLDDAVGQLIAAIDEAGVADRTIIVFFSDNGGYSYLPRSTDPEGFADVPATSNLPLRSGKASLYEGGTREPCIVVWPGKIGPGATSDALLQSIDFYPTLLAMCGLTPHADVELDGVDQDRCAAWPRPGARPGLLPFSARQRTANGHHTWIPAWRLRAKGRLEADPLLRRQR